MANIFKARLYPLAVDLWNILKSLMKSQQQWNGAQYFAMEAAQSDEWMNENVFSSSESLC